MKRLSLVVSLAMTLAAVSAVAAPKQQHLRGTIQSLGNHQLVLHTRSGQNETVALDAKTTYVYVVKSSLADIQKNDFVGTSTKNVDGKMVALEVHIFPNSMRGMGEGHYGWDKLPDTTGRKLVSASMTNGNVQDVAASGAGQKLVSASMTNGDVRASRTTGGAKVITVTYKSGQKQVVVPSSAAIVAFQKADSTALQDGAKAFVIASEVDGKLTAAFVAVGKDEITPPF